MALRKLIKSLFGLLVLTTVGSAQTNWTMRGFDTNRTGANLHETTLNQSNVNTGQFGKLFSRPVDGQIYAQPLVVSNVNIPTKGVLNVVYVCTMHDSVYCFDAESTTANTPLWKRSFIDEANGITTLPYQYLTGYPDIHPEVGIVSTPALDVKAKMLYVVVRTLEGDPNDDASYHQRLYGLDSRTGATKLGPVEITAQVAGTGDGSVGGVVTYNPRRQNQRPAIVLANGKLYIASASHGDNGPYHGWILCYDAATFNRLGAFCSTPNAGLAGFWMSGHAMPVDENGNLFAVTGNGNFNPTAGNFGDSVVKINGSTLAPMDYFTPYNQGDLESWDADLGSCGPVLIPGTNLVIAGSKESKIYVMDRSNMGQYSTTDDNHIVQWWWAGNGHMHGTPAYWHGGPSGNNLYVWTENDRLKGYSFKSGKFKTTPFATSAMQAPPGMPGGFLTISSNGTTANSAVVWATLPFTGDSNWNTVPGVLRAFRANDLTEIWNSHSLPDDDFGNFAKFNPPVVVNGKVYVATFSNALAVYGLLPPVPPNAPVNLTAEPGDKEVALTWTAGHGSASFEVRRGPVGGPFTKVGDVTGDPIYVDKNLANGTAYGYVVIAKNAYGDSSASNEADGTPAAADMANGTGIRGVYYNDGADNNNHFITSPLGRKDATINFDWGNGSPAAAIQEDHFSVTWFGTVMAKQTGYYTFQTITDDGTRLWFKGKLIIDNWTDHAPTSDISGRVLLVAGTRYPIQMELYENGGGAVGRLLWNGPGIDGYAVVPATSLYVMASPYPTLDGAIDLASQFNGDAISYASNPQDGNIGFGGQTFAAETMPDSLTINIAKPFTFRIGSKSNGQNNVINADGRTIMVPATSATRLYVLGCAINGTQSGDFKLNYSDGTSTTVTTGFTDWIAPSPRNREQLAIRFDRRHSPTGDVVSAGSLYYYSLTVDATKRLVSVTLPTNDSMKVFGLSVRR